MPDRFSEDEARRIFARAAERQQAAEPTREGLSLAELQEVGRAAGLDPAHVAAAVAEVRGGAGPAAPPATFLGVDVEPRASRVLPGSVTDEVWGQVVGRLRRTFGSKGTPTDVGRVREWTSGPNSNLLVTVEPREGGAAVTLVTSKAQDARGMRVLPWVLGGFALLCSIGPLFGSGVAVAGGLAMALVLMLLAVAVPLANRRSYQSWARRRQGQFDALLDQFELLARDAAPPDADRPALTASEGGAGRLGLDALDAPPEPDASVPGRRTRA